MNSEEPFINENLWEIVREDVIEINTNDRASGFRIFPGI